jgi:hypothetical protein
MRYLPDYLCGGMKVAHRQGTSGQCNIEIGLTPSRTFDFGGLKLSPLFLKPRLQISPKLIGQGAHLPSLILGHGPQSAQRLAQETFLSEILELPGLQFRGLSDSFKFLKGL